MITHGSLFSGIGGFDLASQWAGFRNVFQCEIDPFCNKVLAQHFPKVARYQNIKDFEGTGYKGMIDILSGGFPCQPFSIMGHKKGKEDDRYLFPEMLRVIRAIQPRFVVAENVPGILGHAHDEVCTNLEAAGYTVETYCIPALAVGAPHWRKRIWFVAYSNRRRREGILPPTKKNVLPTRPESNDNLQVWNREMPPITDGCGVVNGIPARVDRIKSLGNAIVPQVAYHIFKILEAYNSKYYLKA